MKTNLILISTFILFITSGSYGFSEYIPQHKVSPKNKEEFGVSVTALDKTICLGAKSRHWRVEYLRSLQDLDVTSVKMFILKEDSVMFSTHLSSNLPVEKSEKESGRKLHVKFCESFEGNQDVMLIFKYKKGTETRLFLNLNISEFE